MKVFISWSGKTSHSIAVALHEWLPSVIQSIRPFVSSQDIEKGSGWLTTMTSELANSDFGIICLTPTNLESKWISFEAGALAKSFGHQKVCPLLWGLEPATVEGPLAQFQMAICNKNDICKLLHDINKTISTDKIPTERLDSIFKTWWPQLEEALGKISPEKEIKPKDRSERDLLEEILKLSRSTAGKIEDKISMNSVLLNSTYMPTSFPNSEYTGYLSPTISDSSILQNQSTPTSFTNPLLMQNQGSPSYFLQTHNPIQNLAHVALPESQITVGLDGKIILANLKKKE